MVRFGVIGLGFMGRCHLATLAGHEQAEIVAVHDVEAERLRGPLGPGGGNLETGGKAWDESAVRRCTAAGEIFDDPAIDAVVVATPTHLHAEISCAALSAGKHVFCEKPMALTLADCDRMLAAAERGGRVLTIGHCIRFWGEYAAAAEMVRSGRFGRLKWLSLSRRCCVPRFGAREWFADPAKSGGGLFDLHIHDVDYAVYLLGMPRAVRAWGEVGPAGEINQVAAWYDYGPSGPSVQIEGGWRAGPAVPFVMSFEMDLGEATVAYASDREPAMRVYADGEVPAVSAVSGYVAEMDHFIGCVKAGSASEIVPPASSRQSVALACAEAESVRRGQAVEVS